MDSIFAGLPRALAELQFPLQDLRAPDEVGEDKNNLVSERVRGLTARGRGQGRAEEKQTHHDRSGYLSQSAGTVFK